MTVKTIPCAMALSTLLAMSVTSRTAHAQAQPPAPAAAPAAAPTIPDADKQALTALQIQVAGLQYAQQVLQKELDSASVELQRTIAKLRATCGSDHELTPQLTCAKKPAEPTKAGAGSKPGGGV